MLRRCAQIALVGIFIAGGIPAQAQMVLIPIPGPTVTCPRPSSKLARLSIARARATLPQFWAAYRVASWWNRDGFRVLVPFTMADGRDIALWVRVKSVARTEFTGVLEQASPTDKHFRVGDSANGKLADPVDWSFSGMRDGDRKYGDFYWRTMADHSCSLEDRKTLYSSFLTPDVMPKSWGP